MDGIISRGEYMIIALLIEPALVNNTLQIAGN